MKFSDFKYIIGPVVKGPENHLHDRYVVMLYDIFDRLGIPHTFTGLYRYRNSRPFEKEIPTEQIRNKDAQWIEFAVDFEAYFLFSDHVLWTTECLRHNSPFFIDEEWNFVKYTA